MIVSIIGLGLIGGSMAIDLKKSGFCSHTIGVDNNVFHTLKALKLGIVDEVRDLEYAIKQSDLVILAVPTDAALKLVPKIMDMIDDQVITDVCSTKESICSIISDHPKRKYFVAAHPMAGTEFNGPEAAISGLFDGKASILCETEKSGKGALNKVKSLYKTLAMRIITMDPVSHDMHAAYVSHISHISSFALALTVLEKEGDEKNIFDLASGGFDSTVRLAKSSAAMWAPILADNSENVTRVLQTYIEQLEDFKRAIENKNTGAITRKIESANKIKKVLAKQTASTEQELAKQLIINN